MRKFLSVLFVFSFVLTGFAFAAELTPGELAALEAKQAAARQAMETTSATPITEELVASADQPVSADVVATAVPASPDVNGHSETLVSVNADAKAILAEAQALVDAMGGEISLADAIREVKAHHAAREAVVEAPKTDAEPKPEVKTVVVSADAPKPAVVTTKAVSTDAGKATIVTPSNASVDSELAGKIFIDPDEKIISYKQLVLNRTVNGGEEMIESTVGHGKRIKGDPRYAIVGGTPYRGVPDLNGHSDGAPVNLTAFTKEKIINGGLMVATPMTITGLNAKGKKITIWLNVCVAARNGGYVRNVFGSANLREFFDPRNVNHMEMTDQEWVERERAWGAARPNGGDPSYFALIIVEKTGSYAVLFNDDGTQLKTFKVSNDDHLDVKGAASTIYQKAPEFFVSLSSGLKPSLKDAKIAPKKVAKKRSK